MIRHITFERILFLLVLLWAAVFTLLNTVPSFAEDPGLGWHLQTGDWIREHLRIPYFDPFLSKPRPWISDQWLSDILFSSLYSLAGWQLLYGVVFFLYLAAFFLIILPRVVSGSGSYLASCIALILSYRLGLIHLLIRPTLLGFFCFVCLYAFLHDRRGDNAPASLRQMLPVPVLFLVWANLHPSFVLGFVLLGIWCCDQYMGRRWSVWQLVFLSLMSLVVTLINPYTWHLHNSIYALAVNQYFMQLHHEWHALQWISAEGQTTMILAGTIFLGLLLSRKYREALCPYVLGSVVVFLLMGIAKVRVLPYFAVVACIPVAQALVALMKHAFFEKFSFLDSFRRMATSSAKDSSRYEKFFLVCIFAGIVVFADSYGPSIQRYPHSLAAFLNARSDDKRLVVYAPPRLGGFLARYVTNAAPVIDDRNTLIGEEFYREFFDSYETAPQLMQYARQHNVTHLILPVAIVEQLGLSALPSLLKLSADERYVLFKIVSS